ncbi:winged helix-turn-helix domain-containing protein [Reyranella sp. CPCC 100927]|uniref:ATP-binding protein n=1 Tax=Reyranella sp. CPCC 100927 TaxID=2599616 RepID=UPI0011B684D0|nr:winged helix-turn-helix domain-containing protein [Reyranella sp. CPCC 100927]TWT10668.1 transcriptional regulator [Reyranella sp. CPCC 100927]
MAGPSAQAGDIISFGPFSLSASSRLLMKGGAPVELGARTLDILIALASRPNEAINKRDLLAQVWPDVTVEESSLRFHMARLRKALGDGKDGARYITTLAGRGYCFVAPVLRSSHPVTAPAADTIHLPHANLPGRLARMVGRADDVLAISKLLAAQRFVTIVGSGGVGKTTVAVAVAHDLIDAFGGAVLFVDLGTLIAADLTVTAVASMLGLPVRSDDATPSLVRHLRDKRILLILDTCEHVIDTVAPLAARIFAAAPQVHILATSREALRVEGEHVYKLEPLACPPDDPALAAEVVRAFPAVQVFMERAAAGGARLTFNDADASVVADICRKLDGVALAIELAAGRVGAYGLQQTAALLDQRLTRLWPGQRTAPPRQKTLQATLDWSYALLSDVESKVLRRLAVFVGHFTMDAALAVVTSDSIHESVVFGAIDSLVAKSMLATRPAGAMMRYRLLDATRAYALDIGIAGAELADLAVRHATYYRDWLKQIGGTAPALSAAAERMPLLANLNNVRAALEWCFGANGNTGIGLELAAAAAPVFLAMSLLPECQRWSERAIEALTDTTRGGTEEMRLQSALGMSLMFIHASSEKAQQALDRGLAIAEDHGDALHRLQVLGPLHMFHLRIGHFKDALHYAQQGVAAAKALDDPAARTLAHALAGISLHVIGDLGAARVELETALRHSRDSQGTRAIYLGFDGQTLASIVLARNLWLQGSAAQAHELLHQAVKDAERRNHPVTLAIALIYAISTLFWTGDLDGAEKHVERFVAHAQRHSLAPYLAVGQGFKGRLELLRGDAKGGVESLQSCLMQFHAARYELLTTPFSATLAEGLAALGRQAEAMAVMDEAITLCETGGDLVYMPDLLRVKGRLLLASMPSGEGAEQCFRESLEWSRRQGAPAWELRTAVDYAALLSDRGDADRARALLRPVFEPFAEGLDTADARSAARLLASLG